MSHKKFYEVSCNICYNLLVYIDFHSQPSLESEVYTNATCDNNNWMKYLQ